MVLYCATLRGLPRLLLTNTFRCSRCSTKAAPKSDMRGLPRIHDYYAVRGLPRLQSMCRVSVTERLGLSRARSGP
eukprot:6976658-Pyramimonas_sp.AAC.1